MSASGLTLNLGLRYDLQFLDTDQHRHEQRVAPSGVRVVAGESQRSRRPRERRALLRSCTAPAGGQRHPVRRQHNGSANLHQPSVSAIIPTQAGAPRFRTSCPLDS